MGSVYLLTVRQLLGRWRLLIMTLLALLPVIVTVLTLRSTSAPEVGEFETVVYSAMLLGTIAPLVVLAIATAAFGSEVEDRTLANLTLAPIARWRIAVPKLLAALSIAAPFIAASALVSSHVAFLGDVRATVAVTAGALVGVVLYASAFTWLGLVTSQAIGIGLCYIVLWEGFFSGYVTGARLLSIRHYSIALINGLDPRRFAEAADLSFGAAVTISVVVSGTFLLLTIRHLRRMDVP